MNLHEECLLKYLLNPIDLSISTRILKINNLLIQKGKFECKLKGKNNFKLA
ncbi:MAG: hypothetical protein Q4E83_01625 [bacterium]|nr:hypothetical protein [bacterium]